MIKKNHLEVTDKVVIFQCLQIYLSIKAPTDDWKIHNEANNKQSIAML